MRRLARFALAFSGAILLCCTLLPPAWPVWLAGLCLPAAAAVFFFRPTAYRQALPLLLGFAVGFLWFQSWRALFLAPAEALAGTTGPAEAVVTDFPEETAYGVRIQVRVLRGPGIPTRLYADETWGELQPGDRIAFTASFRSASLLRGETSSSYLSAGIFLVAYAKGEPDAARRPERPPLWTLPVRCSRALVRSIRAVFPDDVSGLIAAVVLGEREYLGDGDAAALRRAGLSHTVAVSGMHVSFLTSALLFFCRRRSRLTAALVIPALVFFAMLTGLRPSVVRAVVMQIFLLLAPVFRRETDGPTSLGAALLLLLAANPYASVNIGLQLSFAATAGIYLVSSPALERLSERFSTDEASAPAKRLRCALCLSAGGVLLISLGATLFTAPLTALYFRSVSLAAVLSGLLTMWAVTLVFLLGLAAALVGLFHTGAGAAVALLPALCARWVLAVARGLGSLPFSAVPLNSFYYRVWLAASCVLAAACALLRKKGLRPVLPLCGSVLLLCAAMVLTRLTYAAAPLTVTALDVGQGAATLLLSQGRAALVDCGGSASNNAGDIAADHLQALGLSRLDLLVLTHFDSDHFNGVEELFRRLEISAVVIPDAEDPYGRREQLLSWAEEGGAQVETLTQLSQAALGAAELTLYPPLGSGTTNEAGLMVLCSMGGYDVLITGDADSAVEAMLTKYHAIPDIELLIVGHHGARTSTSAEFLAAVKPETAVISVGYNTYGHPAPETLARLEDAGVQVYRTDRQGSVTVKTGG